MSDIARSKSSGDKLSADEINQDLPVQGTGGATINGGTTPAPVYINSSDGELYECDSDDSEKLEFIGFVVNNTSDGNAATLQKNGVVEGFSGLSAGSKYYVQDAGGIGTTPGTYVVLVGIALSSTELLVIKEEQCESIKALIASDNLKVSDDTEESTTSTSYVKMKEIKVRAPGTVRVKFDLKEITSSGGPYYANARIRINGSEVGTERSTTSGTYVPYSEDIYVNVDDLNNDGALVQLYLKGGHSSYCTAYVRNFRIYFDQVKKPLTEVV